MKGVILAGGNGTRLAPCTNVIGKQLLPVFDKPMIYYPISTLIHAGVEEILIICKPTEVELFKILLGDGSQFGISVAYKVQVSPAGVAQGLQMADDFVQKESFWFILGDNFFHGPTFGGELRNLNLNQGASIFAYRVKDPTQYGVITFMTDSDEISEIEEKPLLNKSPWAIPGLYFFDNTAIKRASECVPSTRGELEIIDVLKSYLAQGKLSAQKISRGNTWLDLGTSESLATATEFVRLIQDRQGLIIGSPEEAAFASELISSDQIINLASKYPSSDYYQKLVVSLSKK
jgi:glucose-1-phosphate thymidylyltransferase